MELELVFNQPDNISSISVQYKYATVTQTFQSCMRHIINNKNGRLFDHVTYICNRLLKDNISETKNIIILQFQIGYFL